MSHPARPGQAAPILLVASNFPPVVGGSAAVYGAVAQHLGGRAIVLAPRIHYEDGRALAGWQMQDAAAAHRTVRLPLLRTRLGARGTVARLADVGIRVRLAAAILRLVLVDGARSLCVGELLASAWLLRLARRIPRLRGIAYVHGEEITTVGGYDPDHARARAALLAADRIIVVSRFTEAAVAALLGPAARPGQVIRIENGVDTRRFRPAPRDPALAARYGLGRGFTFVSVSRLVARKGIDHAILAFALMAWDRPDCRFLVVGEGPEAPRLQALAAKTGLADRIVFAGAVPAAALADHYRLGDAFIMPNRTMPDGDTEGFGLVFLEANACGLPVIAGRDGGSPDAVRHDQNGLSVDGQDIPAIAAAMAALHDDPALRQRLAEAGLAAAAAADWRSRARAFEAACDDGR